MTRILIDTQELGELADAWQSAAGEVAEISVGLFAATAHSSISTLIDFGLSGTNPMPDIERVVASGGQLTALAVGLEQCSVQCRLQLARIYAEEATQAIESAGSSILHDIAAGLQAVEHWGVEAWDFATGVVTGFVETAAWARGMVPEWGTPVGMREVAARNYNELTPAATDRGATVAGMRSQLQTAVAGGWSWLVQYGKNHPEDWRFGHNGQADVSALQAALAAATPVELAMLSDLMAAGMQPWQLAEFLCGGHVVIHDGGKLFRQWRTLTSKHSRFSSHYGRVDQYAVDGPLVHEALFGVDDHGDTFIQLESQAMDPADPARRLEWAQHALGGGVDWQKWPHNDGPWGSSNWTDPSGLEHGTAGPIELPG